MARAVRKSAVPWFGDAFRQAREDAGLTQEEAARELRVSHRTIQHWEAGTKTPRAGTLYSRICPLFGWTWELPFRFPDSDTAGYLGQPEWPMADEPDALAVVG